MAYETKFTRMTPAADFSYEEMQQQAQLKFELEQVEQYLTETFPEETEVKDRYPELAIEALGGEFFYAVWKNQQETEKENGKHQDVQEEK
jgi:hypothetical protein